MIEDVETRICPVCGFDFVPDEHDRIYCGDFCRKKAAEKLRAKLAPKPERTDPRKGKPWPKDRFKQNKPARAEEHKEPKMEIEEKLGELMTETKQAEDPRCEVCGKAFTPRKAGQTTCCRACTIKLYHMRKKASGAAPKNPAPKPAAAPAPEIPADTIAIDKAVAASIITALVMRMTPRHLSRELGHLARLAEGGEE